MRKHVHVGWPIGIAAAAAVVVAAVALVDAHDRSQKETWALHWQHTHDRFAEHVRCMEDPHCDSMKILPHADDQ